MVEDKFRDLVLHKMDFFYSFSTGFTKIFEIKTFLKYIISTFERSVLVVILLGNFYTCLYTRSTRPLEFVLSSFMLLKYFCSA